MLLKIATARNTQPKINKTPPNGVIMANAVTLLKQSRYKLPLKRIVPARKKMEAVFRYLDVR